MHNCLSTEYGKRKIRPTPQTLARGTYVHVNCRKIYGIPKILSFSGERGGTYKSVNILNFILLSQNFGPYRKYIGK
jgi:hypothetical protein